VRLCCSSSTLCLSCTGSMSLRLHRVLLWHIQLALLQHGCVILAHLRLVYVVHGTSRSMPLCAHEPSAANVYSHTIPAAPLETVTYRHCLVNNTYNLRGDLIMLSWDCFLANMCVPKRLVVFLHQGLRFYAFVVDGFVSTPTCGSQMFQRPQTGKEQPHC
jgi:hypothetical protein